MNLHLRRFKMFNKTCSKHRCYRPVLSQPDMTQPAQTYIWTVGTSSRMIIAHPHKPLEDPAYCYFHERFPRYPNPEIFRRVQK